tara:strand:- start:155 stop:862 length:708 start_codon:yes stop_codon:yes gene_type:complete
MFKIINKINYKLFLITFYILFFSCDKNDKKPKKNIELSKKSEIITEIKKEEKFKLSDENVMEFFLEYDKHNKENLVRIVTDYGNIEIQLFDNTKFHRSNFIYLTKKNYFEDTQFYRVINNFVIQAGNSDNRKVSQKRKKIGRYLLPNDLDKGYSHERGMVSMPSSLVDNPYKMASPFEFFIVQSKNGAHHLDGNYTVFGRVISGMDTVDKIAETPTDDLDWPLQNIYIKRVEIIE